MIASLGYDIATVGIAVCFAVIIVIAIAFSR